ncbi:aminotransferase class V-fold PLP-dependent enzyme [Synechococcus sp. PCC 6312]|uniref:aminotransferase class V-fold PLP-dependent enzyme n=1 Tax=Synechococcus sp. (strain ATCC 27167 / PCC 6312) TaxID=195253 RepID=UPI00029F02FF|nr:aminotransferase class V-fold PLP-dependent enzyme [Synechococcus sp. PCC 6312]AFY59361.1 selenocysteine lyase [Synechococcus sp. PCC 6312]
MVLTESKITEIRQQFLALQSKTYLNFGGQGPLPNPAWEAMQNSYLHIQQAGPFCTKNYAYISSQTTALRQALSQELNITPDTLALTDSVTTGCNIVLWGLDWRAGDHLLLTDCEHPGVLAIGQQLQARFGIDLTVLPLLQQAQADPEHLVTCFRQALTPRTRLVALSHLLWNTGTTLPLKEIVATCHKQGVLVLADAAQSVGMMPLDLPGLGVDFYAFTGHKWFCGPDGLGGLYVHPEQLGHLQPTYVGWRSIKNGPQGFPESFQATAAKFEIATTAFPLVPGLTAALDFHRQAGTTPTRYEQICELSTYLWQGLANIPGVQCLTSTPPSSGLVTFQLESGKHGALVEWLENQGILVRLLLFPNSVRACVHYMSLLKECDQLIGAVAEFTHG